ncbi:Retrovirus-related Pol polyprotein from transposon TNT 1-94 [Araneus ventricosus]|uniref:Retrovirus-related Pol polyprotein from transposon TNT 1-94 n=1 Tax=Araneus ventricosus TaxID=182803 RepID=A0A4Y2LDN9_ARAVE|nr:Retrovirus-related Pol polyprotein from transposon TNT 1-94 [Araneus ventricosus]
MVEEMDTMTDREVWVLVSKPLNQKVLGNRWGYTLKKNENNDVVKFKARLVAQGFRQNKGETYDEVFSPVINFSIIRLFFSLFVCHLKWQHCQLDIKCAYLYAPLHKEIYMCQPQGFVNENKPDHVCLLKKAIYGLKQSGREWFQEMNTTLDRLKFRKLKWVNCVYFYQNNVVLLLYVDDIILIGKSNDYVNKVIELLKCHFDLRILGKTQKLLGVEFQELDGNLFMHQNDYINKICELYKEFNFPVSSLPIAKGTVLSKLQCPSTSVEITEMKNYPYRSLLGSLSYIASRTRPDISYAVNILSQFQENPGIIHWNILLKLLGYLSTTRGLQLNLSRVSDLNVECYSDADFAANCDDRVSIGGFIILLDEVPISWRTSKQKCISLSTMEAEYVSLTDASKELLWIQRILEEYKLNNSNYASWLDDIKVVLMEKNLWRITEESEVSPDEALFPKEYNEFQVRKNKAYATIYLSIENEYRILISEVDDSPQAWKILQKHFRPDSRARVISLTDEFFSCKISEDEDIGLFAARLKKIIIDLKDAGKPIADWYQAFQLIRYLPADYQGMIQIIYRWSDEKFKFINVLNELIAEEARLKQSKSDLEVVALHSANRNSTKKKLESKVKRFSNSEQISLSKAHCKYKNKKPNRARNLNVESSFITEACFNETNGNRNSWVFDTAASSHFCGNKNLFHEFQPLNNNTNMSVAIDGVNCKIEGIGTVKLLFKKG